MALIWFQIQFRNFDAMEYKQTKLSHMPRRSNALILATSHVYKETEQATATP